jgi:serine/threonine protein kinase
MEDGPHTPKIDVFSFGLILYEIITGQAVFPLFPSVTQTCREVQQRIRSRTLPSLPVESGALMDGLIRRCLSQDPRGRPSFAEIFHEIENSNFAILPGVDCKEIRKSVDEILSWEGEATNRKT